MSANNKNADEVVSDALLEKLRTYAAKPQEAGDALRAVVAKIHMRITSSGMQLYRNFSSRDSITLYFRRHCAN